MYISLKWIQDIIGVQKLTLNELVNRLTLAGFEIESITNKTDFESSDFILDISFTANRADVSNIRGLITEIIALFTSNVFLEIPTHINPLILVNSQTHLNIFNIDQKTQIKQLNAKVYPIDLDLKTNKIKFLSGRLYNIVNNYKAWQNNYSLWEWYLQKKSFTNVIKKLSTENISHANKYITLGNLRSKKIEVKSSPNWIKKRLVIMGFKPINNIIDTINYLLIETGQVFFAYDLKILEDLMATTNLVFSTQYATENCLLAISESKTIALNNNILTLTLNNKIISIPGFIQNYNTIVNKATSSFLLQYGLSDPKRIKKSSKILNLRTDYSIKSERQTDLNLLEQAYLRLNHLFWVQNIKFEHELSTNNSFKDLQPDFSLFSRYIAQSEKKLKISYKNVTTLTGPYKKSNVLNNFQIIRNLKLLNFKINLQTDQDCYILIPLARKIDIEREVDLIEEIIRVIGFNKFKPIKIDNTEFGYLTKFEKLRRRLRSYFVNLGFNESVHSILSKNFSKTQIRLKNPLFNESSSLRLSLIDGLVDKVEYNKKNIGEAFETFELGRVYNLLSDGKKKEIELISGVFGGQLFHSAWGEQNSSINWFEAKGILETLMEKLNLSLPIYWNPEKNHYRTRFHNNLTTNLFIGDQKLGIFGQIHPILALRKNLQKKLYLFEINTEILNRFSENKNLINYISYSSYPISYLDLSFIVNKSIFSDELKKIIYRLGQPLLKNISLFDYYSDTPIEEGYCSLSFKLKFQSDTRTLSNEEVLKIINPIILYLEKHYDLKFQE